MNHGPALSPRRAGQAPRRGLGVLRRARGHRRLAAQPFERREQIGPHCKSSTAAADFWGPSLEGGDGGRRAPRREREPPGGAPAPGGDPCRALLAVARQNILRIELSDGFGNFTDPLPIAQREFCLGAAALSPRGAARGDPGPAAAAEPRAARGAHADRQRGAPRQRQPRLRWFLSVVAVPFSVRGSGKNQQGFALPTRSQ